jgi:phosphoribosylamine--glycine ligase
MGPEISVFAVLDGTRAAWFAASRDHKRLLDGDRGPNTGGMGAFTPVRDADAGLMETVVREVLDPSLAELRRRGLDYRGLLYIGLMLTPEGPKVLEYNCRFGDPETQVVLPSYPGDLFDLLDGAARGRLSVEGALPVEGKALGIVMAASGYPRSPRRGDAIRGLESLPEEALVFHAGVKREGDALCTAGGRVLCVVARDEDLARAREKALRYLGGIEFEGAQWRTDIALKEVGS